MFAMPGCTATPRPSSSEVEGSVDRKLVHLSGKRHIAESKVIPDDPGKRGCKMSVAPIDADNHYYESLDAFTRHLDPAFKRRGVRPVQDGKRVQLLIGDRVNRFVP